jgi:uncharacterized protein YrrD
LRRVKDLGRPLSYLVLETGAPVLSSDGERVGRVKEVRADTQSDIFDGIVVHEGMLMGREHLVTGDQIEEIFERGVLLKLDAAAFEALAAPG